MKFFTIIKKDSERVPQKNFASIGGKPLWKHTVERFSEYPVFIDTDSKAILRECEGEGLQTVTAYERLSDHVEWENNAAQLGSPVNAMLGRFMAEQVTDWDETIVLFHVTSPFLRLETVAEAAGWLDKGFASVQSVIELKDFTWSGHRDSSSALNFDPRRVVRTQDLPSLFVSRGAFFILRRREFERTGTRDAEPRYLYPLGPLEGIDIDTPADLEFARLVSSGMENEAH